MTKEELGREKSGDENREENRGRKMGLGPRMYVKVVKKGKNSRMRKEKVWWGENVGLTKKRCQEMHQLTGPARPASSSSNGKLPAQTERLRAEQEGKDK